MKPIFLVVLFFYQGEWVMLDGFLPQPQPNQQTCEERRDFADAYIGNIEVLPEHHVFCLETTIEEGPESVREYVAKNLAEAI